MSGHYKQKSFTPLENKQVHSRYFLTRFNFRTGFTLLELLIVMAVLAILASILLVVVKPQQIFQKARDTQRIADIQRINKTLQIAFSENSKLESNLPTKTVYLSLQDPNSICSAYTSQLPTLSAGWSYRCSNTPRDTKGNGWIPIDFSTISIINIDSLPTDPKNSPPYFYSFTTGGSFELTAKLEINTNSMRSDGGSSNYAFEAGSDLTLTPAVIENMNASLKLVSLSSSYDAANAENYCGTTFGSDHHLYIPRSLTNIKEAIAFANNDTGYLYILGVYPKWNGATCANIALNSASSNCNWKAGDNKSFYVSDRTNIYEPNGDNCTTCSMYYSFNVDGTVNWYNDIGYPGYTATKFICGND